MDRTHVAYPCTSTMVAARCKVQPCCAKRRAPLLSQARLKWYTDARPIAQKGPKHAYTCKQVRWSPVAAVVGGQLAHRTLGVDVWARCTTFPSASRPAIGRACSQTAVMFKKGCPINQRSAVSGADRKKLRRALQQHFPALDDAAADQLLPNKAGDMELAKVPAPSRTCIYLHDK